MHRVLVSPHEIRDAYVTINDPKRLHYLRRVVRIRVGEAIECFDGLGTKYTGTVLSLTSQCLTVAVDRRVQESSSPCPITLIQALIRPERFEWVIEKATELGVAQILPVITARTTSRLSADSRGVRWRRIAESAAAQCGGTSIPAIGIPASFERVIQSMTASYALLATLEVVGPSLQERLTLSPPSGAVVLAIGPEGDFTSEEVQFALQRGLQPVSLGQRTLRSETAAIAALAILQHVLGAL